MCDHKATDLILHHIKEKVRRAKNLTLLLQSNKCKWINDFKYPWWGFARPLRSPGMFRHILLYIGQLDQHTNEPYYHAV